MFIVNVKKLVSPQNITELHFIIYSLISPFQGQKSNDPFELDISVPDPVLKAHLCTSCLDIQFPTAGKHE
jgi:hypothetical protein